VKGARAQGGKGPFYGALVAILVVGAGLLWYMSHRPAEASAITIDPKDAIGVKAEGYTLGNPTAPVEIIEFADFECPGCGQFATVTEPDVRTRLINTGQVRYRLFDFQVNSSHRNSPSASMAAACASDQGKFWEMHDKLFAGQNEWSTFATSSPRSEFEKYARELGLDVKAWGQCYDTAKYKGRLAANAEEAGRRKVQGTPTFIIGDKMLSGLQPYDVLKKLVDSARAKTPAPAVADSAKAPIAKRG